MNTTRTPWYKRISAGQWVALYFVIIGWLLLRGGGQSNTTGLIDTGNFHVNRYRYQRESECQNHEPTNSTV